MELKFTPEEGNMEQCDKDFQVSTITKLQEVTKQLLPLKEFMKQNKRGYIGTFYPFCSIFL